jgi:aldehyde dehydrogenase (NAD+)
VVKPAEDAGLSLIRIAELALEAGFPEGALNVVSGLGEEAGAALASHPGIDFISFTGSPEVGTLIQAAAATNHIGCTLELGGKSPQLVFADADLAEAAPVLVRAIIQNGGQTCSAGSRLLVERRAYAEVVSAVAERFAKLTAGPHDRDLDLGAMANAGQKHRVEGFVARAREAGVPAIAEGRVVEDAPAGGYYVKPVLFGPVPSANDLACEEVFGPVLSVIPFEDEADAIRLANGTPYGLVAGVWTGDARRSMRVARAMRCGQVFVNGFGAGGGIELPFGGVKKSGHGREKGFEALYEFSASKTIVVNHG